MQNRNSSFDSKIRINLSNIKVLNTQTESDDPARLLKNFNSNSVFARGNSRNQYFPRPNMPVKTT